MITFRIYVINRDTGEQRELAVNAYEPTPVPPPVNGALDLPPCRCPRCRPAITDAPMAHDT